MPHTRTRTYRLFISMLLAALLLPGFTLSAPAPVQAQAAPEHVAEPFAGYYWRHHGPVTLGQIRSPIHEADGLRVQYFEKGRLEDRRHLTDNPAQMVGYSPLLHKLIADAPFMAIDGLPITYGELEQYRSTYPAPEGVTGGTFWLNEGIFVPADYGLAPVPGYIVPHQFWAYINRLSLFPGGWLHDVGLPITQAFHIIVPTDAGEKRLVVQAFDRTVLLLDLTEQHDWSVRRANIGTDAAWVYTGEPLYEAYPAAPADLYPDAPKRIEVDLGRQWLSAYQGDMLVLDAPISSGKDGFETPTGEWRIYARYRQKTLRGSYNGETWNVPDVPAVMFYWGGFAIHGVYWHDRFGTGERHSHGCVGVAPHDAHFLFDWAPNRTRVIVR
jgi:hypothetical protein